MVDYERSNKNRIMLRKLVQKFKPLLRYFYLKLKIVIYGFFAYSRERHWGVAFSLTYTVPKISKVTYKLLKDNNAFYVMEPKGEKSCCLTFDCEDDNNGNADYILDLFAKKNIKATFFVTQKFILNFPHVVTRMKREGHIVGNHTAHHLRLALLTEKQIVQEIRAVEETMKKFTGYDIDKVFRFPFGSYSARSLRIVNKCGYTSFFWSYDLPLDKSCGNLQGMLGRLGILHHNGMIMLFHMEFQGDRMLLPHYIGFLERLHYNFISVATL